MVIFGGSVHVILCTIYYLLTYLLTRTADVSLCKVVDHFERWFSSRDFECARTSFSIDYLESEASTGQCQYRGTNTALEEKEVLKVYIYIHTYIRYPEFLHYSCSSLWLPNWIFLRGIAVQCRKETLFMSVGFQQELERTSWHLSLRVLGD